MSRAGRVTLGIVLVLLACGFLAVAWSMRGLPEMRAGAIGSLVFAVLCAIGAVACLFRASGPVTLRVIGGAIFLADCWYIVSTVMEGKIVSGSRAKPSLLNAIMLFLLVGLPAAYVMITGRYPRWGAHAAAFGASDTQDQNNVKKG